jgi:hypothetical protein
MFQPWSAWRRCLRRHADRPPQFPQDVQRLLEAGAGFTGCPLPLVISISSTGGDRRAGRELVRVHAPPGANRLVQQIPRPDRRARPGRKHRPRRRNGTDEDLSSRNRPTPVVRADRATRPLTRSSPFQVERGTQPEQTVLRPVWRPTRWRWRGTRRGAWSSSTRLRELFVVPAALSDRGVCAAWRGTRWLTGDRELAEILADVRRRSPRSFWERKDATGWICRFHS